MTKLTRPMLRIHKQFVDKGLLLLSQESVQLLKKVMLHSYKDKELIALKDQIYRESGMRFEEYC